MKKCLGVLCLVVAAFSLSMSATTSNAEFRPEPEPLTVSALQIAEYRPGGDPMTFTTIGG